MELIYNINFNNADQAVDQAVEPQMPEPMPLDVRGGEQAEEKVEGEPEKVDPNEQIVADTVLATMKGVASGNMSLNEGLNSIESIAEVHSDVVSASSEDVAAAMAAALPLPEGEGVETASRRWKRKGWRVVWCDKGKPKLTGISSDDAQSACQIINSARGRGVSGRIGKNDDEWTLYYTKEQGLVLYFDGSDSVSEWMGNVRMLAGKSQTDNIKACGQSMAKLIKYYTRYYGKATIAGYSRGCFLAQATISDLGRSHVERAILVASPGLSPATLVNKGLYDECLKVHIEHPSDIVLDFRSIIGSVNAPNNTKVELPTEWWYGPISSHTKLVSLCIPQYASCKKIQCKC